ncbi:MAG: IclR family transcriptional regulator [Rhodoferax sp.]|nr:IclR family transcriptional regulator [Rhodoferax sp.]MBP9928582.1 IclR family transcriptional regulator [Rhodoferax sp.]HQX59873.1 IclR family transcriptional regulator [Burkholderiaceae bacterium]HQZ05052.1 IclR family transcriptional regulator [Burkholderiaceae bacterium]HRA61258.1 IclR family transcriptional regulator [Burkholderiaceae bacterium]
MKTLEVKSAARILDLLELLSVVPGPMRLTDIVRQMDMPKSSAFALLNTLSGRGYVDLSGDGYVISERFRSGDWISGEYGLMRRTAQPVMAMVALDTGESCFLAIAAHDWQIQYVEKSVSGNPLRYDISLPTLRPAHSTSVGLVLLAEQPDDVLQRYLASDRVIKLTEKTETDPERLMQTIAGVRANGYARVANSSVMGASGVAAAIRGVSGMAIGALCVIAPTPRFDAGQDRITEHVRDAAAQIGALLPGRNSPNASVVSVPRGHTQWSA